MLQCRPGLLWQKNLFGRSWQGGRSLREISGTIWRVCWASESHVCLPASRGLPVRSSLSLIFCPAGIKDSANLPCCWHQHVSDVPSTESVRCWGVLAVISITLVCKDGAQAGCQSGLLEEMRHGGNCSSIFFTSCKQNG